MEPARITEGIVSLRMKRDDFLFSGESWSKFHIVHPWASFQDFWLRREHAYNLCNTQAKKFFAEFQRDPKKQAKILADFGAKLDIF